MTRIATAVAFAAVALACGEPHYRLTGAMPPPAVMERCNAYARAVEAEPDREAGEEASGDKVVPDAGGQHGVDERNQQSERARNAYAGCLSRSGY